MINELTIRTAKYSELLTELMNKVEERQATPEGRQYLADNAASIANGIRIARAGAAMEMKAETNPNR